MDAPAAEIEIDPQKVLSALGYEETSEPRRVKGGWDTLLWRFQTADGGDHSLRVYQLARIRPLAWRERVALETCATAGLPAPRVETAGEYEGIPAMVLSWCPGKPILAYLEKKPWLLWRLGRLFGRTQAQLHAVAPPPELVEGAPASWVYALADEYRDLGDHAMSLGLSTGSLIHMDFHPLNLVGEPDRITGIVDWSGAAAGDPRADLARTYITLIAAPMPPGLMRAILSLARRLLIRAWLSGYQEVAGKTPDFQPLMAWAGATFLAEIEQVIGVRADVWGTAEDIARFHRLVDVWARRAGIR